MFQEDHNLVAACRAAIGSVGDAVSWTADNRDLVRREADSVIADLHRSVRRLSKLEAAAQRKMCVGVFGPSQSGKSYLISALARGADGNLLADFGDARPDFVSDINPEGGKESTGLVTRFTMTKPDNIPNGYPVKLRLLSETDIVRILGNAYYEDFNHEDVPDSEAIRQSLDKLSSRQANQNQAPSRSDIEDLHEYFRDNFRHCPRVQMLETYFWPRAIELGPKLSPADRVILFGLVWNGAPRFNELLGRLQAALGSLGHAAEAFAPLSALIPRDSSIIDVATLAGLMTGAGAPIELTGNNGRKASIARSEVTALTAEITIVMVNKPDDFFDYTDLLDFPGYRSRKKNTDVDRVLSSDDAVEELFLRGKVAYLFERYCAERELTSMLLCIGPGPAEVQTLPKVIDGWVRSTHGDTASARAGRPKALYFVMTKFDMEFVKKKGAAQSENSRWNTRIEASLTSFFGGVGEWVQNWESGNPFSNVFWIRNPNVRAEALFQYDDAGRELALRPEQESYVAELKDGYMQSDLVARHVGAAQRGWDAAMALNDGGVTYLRDQLRPLCNPELKRTQIAGSLREEMDRVTARLAIYYRSDDKQAERKQKEELAKRLAGRLAMVAQSQRFGRLLRLFQVADHELYDLFFRIESQELEGPSGDETAESASVLSAPTIVGTAVSADDLLGDIFGTAAPAVAPPPTVSGSPPRKAFKDAAAVRAAEVEKYWLAGLRERAEDAGHQALFAMSELDFGALVHEISMAASRLAVDVRLEEEIRIASRFRNIKRDKLVWKQVSRAAVVINTFVDWLGHDPRETDPGQRTVTVGGRQLSVFQPKAEVTAPPSIAEDQLAYDVQYYRDWIAAFVDVVIRNVDFEGGMNFDPVQNARLGEALVALGWSPSAA